jgi:hypothetical protein
MCCQNNGISHCFALIVHLCQHLPLRAKLIGPRLGLHTKHVIWLGFFRGHKNAEKGAASEEMQSHLRLVNYHHQPWPMHVAHPVR